MVARSLRNRIERTPKGDAVMRRGLSQRRSCTLLKVSRSALRYRAVKAQKNAPVLECMAELGKAYPRFGYRRIRIFLEREGHAMGWGRCYRLWRDTRLQVPRRRPRKRIATGRPRPQAPSLEWFLSRAQVKVVIEAWRRHYNGVRPHSSLGYLTPAAFAARFQPQCPVAQRAGALRDMGGASRPGPLHHRP